MFWSDYWIQNYNVIRRDAGAFIVRLGDPIPVCAVAYGKRRTAAVPFIYRRLVRQNYPEASIMGIVVWPIMSFIVSLIGAVLLLAILSFFRRGTAR